MGKLCDFCCEQRSIVYCKSDAACLCLSCDRNVHSANSLSQRHMRTLICESCHSHPATTRCIDESISLCQDCSYSGHPPGSTHKWEMINYYSDCPSAAEFSRIWSFFSVDQSRWNLEEGEKRGQECQLQENIKLSVEEKEEDDAGMDILASDVCGRFHETGSSHTLSPKACSPRIEHHEPAHDVIDRDFNTSDVDLGLENYDSLFEDAEQLFENGGINSLFEIENSRVNECDFERVQAVMAGTEAIHPACSNPLSIDDSITSCKSDHNVCSPGPAQSTFSNSFSGPNNEREILDKPDCGGLVKDEHQFITPSADYQLSSAIRDVALLRYREKKKSRKFDKKIRYASRKVRADVRKRVKGRFVKAGEMYDYDPLDLIRSQ